ncbi:nucleotide-diphospho-sugar transferase [Chryseolinea sp. T2]|uniref:nucleotide-diphospho-sugar transferase n=1 Tax=Chryseolinea sp. T2 TaxID=3129255 RepID=UPI0030769966
MIGAFETPILFVVFNRPEKTSKVFEILRQLRPAKLYIAADGPREGNLDDIEKCANVKKIVSEVSWDCKVHTLFRPANLGCKMAVSGAISWFFDNVTEGIILEDDTVPRLSFFEFCSERLAAYRNNEAVMHISGHNLLGKWKENKQRGHFSYFGTIWGWATWRRCWKNYDETISAWSDLQVRERVLQFFPKEHRKDREILYDKLYKGEIDTWDYQWTFARLIRNGVCLIPSVNLVTNIGFDAAGTHHETVPKWFKGETYNLPENGEYPRDTKVDKDFDKAYLHAVSGIETSRQPKGLYGQLRSWFSQK